MYQKKTLSYLNFQKSQRRFKKWLGKILNQRPCGKGVIMKYLLAHMGRMAFLAFFMAFLAACGGGGGGGETAPIVTPPVVADPSGKLAAVPCTVEAGSGQCPLDLVPTELKNVLQANILLPDGKSVPVAAKVSVLASLGEQTFELRDGNKMLDRIMVKVGCKAGFSDRGGVCGSSLGDVGKYEMVVGLISAPLVPLPVRISGESCDKLTVVQATNGTSHQSAPGQPSLLSLAYVLTTPSPDGWVHVAQQVTGANNALVFDKFLYDPVSNRLVDDDGTQGDVPPFPPNDDEWKRVSVSDHPDTAISKWAQTSSLLVYTRRTSIGLWCENVVGGVRQGNPVLVPLSQEYDTSFAGLYTFRR